MNANARDDGRGRALDPALLAWLGDVCYTEMLVAVHDSAERPAEQLPERTASPETGKETMFQCNSAPVTAPGESASSDGSRHWLPPTLLDWVPPTLSVTTPSSVDKDGYFHLRNKIEPTLPELDEDDDSVEPVATAANPEPRSAEQPLSGHAYSAIHDTNCDYYISQYQSKAVEASHSHRPNIALLLRRMEAELPQATEMEVKGVTSPAAAASSQGVTSPAAATSSAGWVNRQACDATEVPIAPSGLPEPRSAGASV